MADDVVGHPINHESGRDCERMHIENYQLEEVILPTARREQARRAIRVVVYGRNFRAVAQPLFAFVGETPVSYLRIAPDERSIEGLLLDEPESGSFVEVILGDEDAVRHPIPLDPGAIRRIN